MNIAELKALIADLPDDTPILFEVTDERVCDYRYETAYVKVGEVAEIRWSIGAPDVEPKCYLEAGSYYEPTYSKYISAPKNALLVERC